MADLVGKKLKDFFVQRRLGRGAMAEVYLAQQLSLGRPVALKVLNAELARDPNYVRRFHHEARAAAALVHGGIVQIYEVGETDGVHYIAQEFVPGRNLGELIRSQGSIAPLPTIDILRQVAAALGKAESQGIVHRDIKPENIMLARTGEVKVADFGLARVHGEGINLTQAGITMGTPLYMSPEQIEGRDVDTRSDIYSLGVTAYHMLKGQPPFGGESPITVAVQHLNQPAPPLTVAKLSEASSKLCRIVERMMAKKPDERYANPGSLLADLNSLLAECAKENGSSDIGALLPEMFRMADDCALATGRLEELMTSMNRNRPATWSKSRITAVIVACGVLGVGTAAVTRPESLFTRSQAGPPRFETVWGQIYHAKMVDTEEAWLAVRQNFPQERAYYHDLAKQGLVYFYLTRTRDYSKAIRLLEELAESSQQSLQAFGNAGLVTAYTKLGEDEAAYTANQRLSADMRAELEEHAPRMATLLNNSLDILAARAFGDVEEL